MKETKTKRIIEFPKGIPGFEEYKQYELIQEEGELLAQLNSLENSQAGFIMFRAQAFFGDYIPKVDLGSEEVAALEIREDDTVEIWSILTLCQSDMTKTTVNLRAPIVLNARTAKGAQFILSNDSFSSRQPLFAEIPESHGQEGAYLEGAVR
mgnify:CR=1 FL=1